jgi:hypothetical protein
VPSSIDKIEDKTAETVRDLQGVDMSELIRGINEYLQNPRSRKRPLLPRRSHGPQGIVGASWQTFRAMVEGFTMVLEFIQDLASS